MEDWALLIAIAIPALIAAVAAYVLNSRRVFWGGLCGAVFGLLLRSMTTARYEDPLDEIVDVIQDVLPQTIICATIGGAVLWIVRRRTKSVAASRSTQVPINTK